MEPLTLASAALVLLLVLLALRVPIAFTLGGVACLGLFIVFFDLDGYRTLTKHEGFVAVVSREMLQTGDWVVPSWTCFPPSRLRKTPLSGTCPIWS